MELLHTELLKISVQDQKSNNVELLDYIKTKHKKVKEIQTKFSNLTKDLSMFKEPFTKQSNNI